MLKIAKVKFLPFQDKDMPTALQNINHWIFDMDGTLTVACHDFSYMRQQLGMRDGDTDILAYVARQDAATAIKMVRWLQDYGLDLAQNAQAAQGAVALLTHLHEQGHKLAILTRNERDLAMVTLEAIGVLDYFDEDCILGRESCQPKPKPDGILHVLNKWQADKANAMMVGDYHFDLNAGRNAGVNTMLLHPETNEWPHLSDYYFADCAAVLQQLQQQTA